MANQNLSQFGEKLFVADADHTFIWDTAASISKRVSRNSWLSGTTADFHLGLADAATPVAQTLSVQSVVAGTTNTAGAAFTIDGSQGTGTGAGGPLIFRTAPAGSSGTAQNALGTALTLTAPGYVVPKSWLLQNGFSSGLEMYGSDADALSRNVGNSRRAIFNGVYLVGNSGFSIGWSPNNGVGNDGANFGQADTILVRDGVGTLALRNGAAAQTFRVYGAYPDTGINYARLALSCDTSGNATISTQALGTYTAGTVSINGISASANGNLLNFAGSNGSILSQNNYINLQSNAYAAVQVTGARGAGNEPSSTAIYYGPPSGTIDATSAFKIYRRTGGVDSVPFMVNSAGNVGIGTTSPTSKLDVAGAVSAGTSGNGYQLTNGTTRVSAWGNNQGEGLGGLGLSSSFVVGWSSGADGGNFSGLDTILLRDETAHLALRRGTNGQKFSVYGTYPGANWERFTITAPTSGNVLLGTYKGTGGIARGLELQTDGITRLTINSSGTSFFAGATRFDSFFYIGASNGISLQSGGASDGILLLQNSATNNFNRIQLGGSTDSFPALKRSTTRVQAVLATTDTTFTNIQGKLTTDTDYTAGSIVPTGFLTLYDAQGNAYKVPCVAA